jgi:hypothetical protein
VNTLEIFGPELELEPLKIYGSGTAWMKANLNVHLHDNSWADCCGRWRQFSSGNYLIHVSIQKNTFKNFT